MGEKKVSRKLEKGMFVEMRVVDDGKIVVGFGNAKGGVYVDMDTIPEMAFERASEFAEFVLNQPEKYSEFCEYYGLNKEDIDKNAEEYVRKKQIKQMLEQMGLLEEEKSQLKAVK